MIGYSLPASSCRSSVVEHPIGNGEVVSSILTGSTIPTILIISRPAPAQQFFRWLALVLPGRAGCGVIAPTVRRLNALFSSGRSDDRDERSLSKIDLEKFRLRTFVDRLIDMGEVEIHDEPVPLTGSARSSSGPRRPCCSRSAGPGGRDRRQDRGQPEAPDRRFETTEEKIYDEYFKRLANPKPVVEIPSGDAPVHAVKSPARTSI